MNFDKILRNIIIGIAFLVPFIPFIVSNGLFFPFITGKNFTFRILTELMFGAWIILALRNVIYRPHFSWLLISVLSFIGIIGIADFFGVNPDKSFWSNYERMEGYVTLLHLLGYFLVIGTVFKTKELWDWFLHVSIGVSIFTTTFSLFQLDGFTAINQGGVRVDAKFGNATYLAVYMLFHIFITGLYLLRTKTSIKKIATAAIIGLSLFLIELGNIFSPPQIAFPDEARLYIWIPILLIGGFIYLLVTEEKKFSVQYLKPFLYSLVILIDVFILFYTATRGTILGVLGGILLTGILMTIFGWKRKIVRVVGISALAGVILIVGGFFAIKDTEFAQNNVTLSRFANISVDSGTVQARFVIWSMAWEGVKERPLLGWGQENFNLVFNKEYNPVLFRDEPWFDRVHNIVFDWLIAGGILGLLGYVSIPLVLLYYIWSRKHDAFTFIDKSVLTGLLAAYGFHNVFVFDNIFSYILYFTILAYVYQVTRGEPKEGGVFQKQFDIGFVDRVATPIVIVALIFTVYAFNAKGILASQTLIDALRPQPTPQTNIEKFREALAYESGIGTQEIREQLLQAAARVAGDSSNLELRQELFNLAVTEMENQIEEAPGDARHHLFLASVLDSYGQFEQANTHFVRAQELSPEKQTIRFALAGNLINLGRFDEAEELMKETSELAPDFIDGHVMYAVAAIYNGKPDLADQILEGKNEQVVSNNPRLLQAYFNTGDQEKVRDLWISRVKFNPGNTQFRISLAAAHLALEERDEAVAQIEQVIEMDPNFADQGNFLIQEIRAGRNP